MKQMKVSTRLAILVGSMAVLVYSIGELGLFGITDSNERLQSVYEDRAVPAAELGEIRAQLLEARLAMNAFVVTPTPEFAAQEVALIEASLASIDKKWQVYAAKPRDAQEAALVQAFAAENAKLLKEAFEPALAALRTADPAQVQRVLVQKIRTQFVTTEGALNQLVSFHLDAAKRQFEEATARYRTIQKIAISAVVSGLLFSVLFGFALIRSLGRQLGGEPWQATAVAQRVAAGDLNAAIQLRAGDRTSLMAHLKAMQEGLTEVVKRVRINSDCVATASSQIASGNGDLSVRTEQQASALQETAASMQELTAAVARNADSALQANQLARAASGLAAKGGVVVGQVVTTMKGINDSSKKISDIIGLIDGIAFQTNILALNAAVEAARAGEQGRGFAVVASEVRSLAQRSGQMAREIKSLISASVERVDEGTALVDQAGSTMTDVVNSIHRVTDIVTEISAASDEQSIGVGQVEQALSRMDHGTQQNAMLVEECAAAAESLKQQATSLVQAVAVFSVGPAPARA
jgi:methyl-accepting chemotaxis protein-1 (serine sensor receptor)